MLVATPALRLFLVLLIAASAHLGSSITEREKSKTIDINYSLPSKPLSLHEPVILTLEVHNRGRESITLQLGQDRKAGFLLGLTLPDGTQVKLPNVNHGGVYDLGDLVVPAAGTFKHRLLLNQWYDFKKPGKYQLEARITKPFLVGNGSALGGDMGFTGSFEIGPRIGANLTAACEHLASEIKNLDSAAEWVQAATELSSIGDPVTVPYLQQAMEQQPMVAYI